MTGSVRDRPALLDLANCFTKNFGLCLSCEVFVVRFPWKINHPPLCNSSFSTLNLQSSLVKPHVQSCSQAQHYGFISQGPRSEALEEINTIMGKNQLWLRKRNRKAFYTPVACEDFRAGTESLLQVSVDSIQKSKVKFILLHIIAYICSFGSETHQIVNETLGNEKIFICSSMFVFFF